MWTTLLLWLHYKQMVLIASSKEDSCWELKAAKASGEELLRNLVLVVKHKNILPALWKIKSEDRTTEFGQGRSPANGVFSVMLVGGEV